MDELSFRSRIGIVGINPYVPVSAEQAQRLASGWRRPMPLLVRLNGAAKAWRTNMTPVGDGGFRLHLHGLMRKAAGVDVGDEVEIAITFDPDYRGGPAHPPPQAFAAELERNAAARQAWGALTPSLQKEFLRYFANLKSPEALERNVKRAIAVLSGAKGRFLGRSWNEDVAQSS